MLPQFQLGSHIDLRILSVAILVTFVIKMINAQGFASCLILYYKYGIYQFTTNDVFKRCLQTYLKNLVIEYNQDVMEKYFKLQYV